MEDFEIGDEVEIVYYDRDEQSGTWGTLLGIDDGLLTLEVDGKRKVFNMRSIGFLSVERREEPSPEAARKRAEIDAAFATLAGDYEPEEA